MLKQPSNRKITKQNFPFGKEITISVDNLQFYEVTTFRGINIPNWKLIK